MNLPILSTVQQQLTAVFEQWLTMMREVFSVTSRKSVEPTSHPPLGGTKGALLGVPPTSRKDSHVGVLDVATTSSWHHSTRQWQRSELLPTT